MCECLPSQHPKQYRTASTSTAPAKPPHVCSQCSPARPAHLHTQCITSSAPDVVRTVTSRDTAADNAAFNASDEFLGLMACGGVSSGRRVEDERTQVTSASTMHSGYFTVNPSYSCITPPEDQTSSSSCYPLLLAPRCLLEATASTSTSSSQQSGVTQPRELRDSNAPPRSSTAPNVHGLQEITDSLSALETHSPRASWAGPGQTHKVSSHVSPSACKGKQRTIRQDAATGKLPIYDEVYTPRVASPAPPVRSSSLTSGVGVHCRSDSDSAVLRDIGGRNTPQQSYISSLDSVAHHVTASPRLQQRSVSQHAINFSSGQRHMHSPISQEYSLPHHHHTHSLPQPRPAQSTLPHPKSSPALHSFPEHVSPPTSPRRQVWVPIKKDSLQCTSLIGALPADLPPSSPSLGGRHRLSASCEELSQAAQHTEQAPAPQTIRYSKSGQSIQGQHIPSQFATVRRHTSEQSAGRQSPRLPASSQQFTVPRQPLCSQHASVKPSTHTVCTAHNQRRCPTPPRVLSPQGEMTCHNIADI